MSLNRDFTLARGAAIATQYRFGYVEQAPSGNLTVDENWPGMIVLTPSAAIDLVIDSGVPKGTVFVVINQDATNAITVKLGTTAKGTVAAGASALVFVTDGDVVVK